MSNIKIFAYGSLREGFFNYEKYLKGNVISKKEGKVKNVKLFHMPYKGYPAVIDGNDILVGEVFELSDYDNVVKAVDKMEGFISEGNKDNEYDKSLVEVEYADGSKELCYSYKYNFKADERFAKDAIYIKDGDWKNFMLKENK